MAKRTRNPDRHPVARKPSADARAVAIEALRRVAVDDAWASRALDAEIRRRAVDGRDAALASEIVYGTLRVLPEIDAAVDALLDRPGKVDALCRSALRVGAYQLRHLSRVPPHAAVDACVREVRAQRGPRMAGFVNAILRRLAKSRPEAPEPPTRAVLPGWLRDDLERSLGEERAQRFADLRPLPPPLDLRVTARGDASALSERWRGHVAGVEPLAGLDAALRVRGAGDPRSLEGFERGEFVVQEAGSQLVGALVGARAGDHVADACAGRGGKTLQLAEAVGPTGSVTAIELHEARLEQIPELAAAIGCETPIELVCADLSVGSAGLEGRFDHVLVDAPCTGAGTFHRRPEILARLRPEDPARLGELQVAILERAASLLRPGGQLTYAVCSPLRAEGDDVARRAEALGLRAAAFGEEFRALEDAPGVVRIGPWTPGLGGDCDAYQVFRFER